MKQLVVGPKVVEWTKNRLGGDFTAPVGIGLEEDGNLVVGVVFDNYNKASMAIHVASDGTARWMNKLILHTVFDYAFNQAKVNVLIGLVGEKNWEARRFDEHLGFKITAEIPDAHPDGKLLIYTMRREECRWLRKKHGKQIESAATA